MLETMDEECKKDILKDINIDLEKNKMILINLEQLNIIVEIMDNYWDNFDFNRKDIKFLNEINSKSIIKKLELLNFKQFDIIIDEFELYGRIRELKNETIFYSRF